MNNIHCKHGRGWLLNHSSQMGFMVSQSPYISDKYLENSFILIHSRICRCKHLQTLNHFYSALIKAVMPNI